MNPAIEGELLGRGLRFGLVVARFNELITSQLLAGAWDALVRHGVAPEDVDVVRVPGAFEVPLAAKKLAETGRYAALVALAAVIKGGTPHFEYIANEVSKGVATVALEMGVPVAFGVITADTLEQALERAGAKAGNRGYDAALVALEMANLLPKLSQPRRRARRPRRTAALPEVT